MIKTDRKPSDALQDKCKELVCLLAEAIGDNDEAIIDYDNIDRVEAIETEFRDGFIPFTSGGYHVCLPAALSYHWGTGMAPAPVQPLIDSGERIIAEEWARQYPERPPLVDCITAREGEPGHEWQSAAEDWEMESWQSDDDCYYWKARAMILAPDDRGNATGEPEVYIDAYLCTDSYGRDNISWLACYPGGKADQTVGDFKRTIPAAEFETLTTEALEALAAEAMASLP